MNATRSTGSIAPTHDGNLGSAPSSDPLPNRRYVLITPAKDEEKLIGITIESVVRQTVLPDEWIIVSDGSTDHTDEIVQAASTSHPWIRLVSLPRRDERDFAAVVRATETGVRALRSDNYAYLGLLDSDLRFDPDYFQNVLLAFEADPFLGLAGGHVVDVGLAKDRLPHNREDVPGASQFFRRACFEKLGALVAIPEGGWDALTCARARMVGYRTQLLTHLVIDHLKPRNIGEGRLLRRLWQLGVRDYALGYHPLFEALKCAARLFEPPILLNGTARWIGFLTASAYRNQRMVPADLLEYVRTEQVLRIRRMIGLSSSSSEYRASPR